MKPRNILGDDIDTWDAVRFFENNPIPTGIEIGYIPRWMMNEPGFPFAYMFPSELSANASATTMSRAVPPLRDPMTFNVLMM